ncbi:YciI family protein [Demequina sp. NBRC 110056]|uniref:YciI family protein n=1 Tax=Demequina sp. NBRC 110056 TaxID=1570345 RepID=UPI000A071AC8|nr:YciI family protein [Demequina sp. NBRC 110056]
MTEYLFSVHHDYSKPLFDPSFDVDAMMRDTAAFNERAQKAGIYVFAGGLEAPDTATTVTVREGETLTTDGPFAEARERIGGFWVLKLPDLDTALDWAAEASAACRGPVEVRPFQGV